MIKCGQFGEPRSEAQNKIVKLIFLKKLPIWDRDLTEEEAKQLSEEELLEYGTMRARFQAHIDSINVLVSEQFKKEDEDKNI